MRRLHPWLLILLLACPGIGMAAGTDIVADTIERKADGSIIATGNVVISQYRARQVRDLRLRQLGDGTVSADFTLVLEPGDRHASSHRELLLARQGNAWRITADRPFTATSNGTPIIDTGISDTVNAWRNSWNRRDLDTFLSCYEVTAFPEGQTSREAWIATLKTEFTQPPFRSLHADRILYRASDKHIVATGHVRFVSKGAHIEADSADVDNNSLTGELHDATLFLPDGQRLHASVVQRISDTLFEAEEIRFTACPADAEAWAILAKHARLDQAEGEMTAHGARFEMGGIPLLYAPYLTEPLKRKSGLLMPTIAFGKRRGTEYAQPIYIAPADNWDVTYTPHNMTARGFMNEGEFRHISGIGGEKLAASIIDDRVTHTQRSRLKGDVHWTLPENIRLDATADHVSDHNYLADYAQGSDASQRYLQSQASLSQQFTYGDWNLSTMHQQDMRLASNATVLQIVPRLESHTFLPLGKTPRLHFDQQTTRFARRSGIDGWRTDLNPYLEIPWELAGGGISVTLTTGMHHLQYWLANIAATQPKRASLNGYDASLEVRSDFERISDSGHWRHVISPVLRYDHVWAPDQTGLTNFDSGLSQLTWSNLLSANRFSGNDRIERSHRVTLLLESTLQSKANKDAQARDVLRVRAGVSRNLQRQITDAAVQTQPQHLISNLLGDLAFSPMAGLKISGSAQYAPYDHYFATASGGISWSAAAVKFAASYSLVDRRYATASRLITTSGEIPLGGRWSATGQWQYDALLKLTQQARIGMIYKHPCWSIKVEGYRTNRPSGTTTQANFGGSVLLGFKGLGSVGS